MLVLVLDTSSPAVCAALVRLDVDGTAEVVAERTVVDARRHGELLALGVEAVIAGGPPASVDAVVVGTGPGPFTGLRVGLMTAAAISDALGLPAYGVCSLDGIGLAAGGTSDGAGDVVAVADARRREVYWARYAGGARVDGPSVSRPADLAERLGALADPPLLVGAGASLHREAFAGFALDRSRPHPSPLVLVRVAGRRVLDRAPADPLTPLYLRRPDAVEPGAVKRVTA